MIDSNTYYKVTVTCGPLEDIFYKYGWELEELLLLEGFDQQHDDTIKIEPLTEH